MEFDHAFAGGGDWSFPSPNATPTNPTCGNVLQTPKTTSFPSHFQEAFNTPQMQGYATPQQPQYGSMTPVQRPQTSSETLWSNYYAGIQANTAQAMPVPVPFQVGYAAPAISPGIHHSFQMSPAQQATAQMSFNSSQMQTPPPTRGMSAKKSQPTQIAFGTPSTIESRRFVTPQQQVPTDAVLAGTHAPLPLPQLQFSPDMFQFTNFGPASAPVVPQTRLLWEQMGSPATGVSQRSPMEDPFAPPMQQHDAWPAPLPLPGQVQAMSFETPEMASFPLQPPHPRPMSAATTHHSFAHSTPVAPATASLDPSLIYSSPLRPIVRPGSRTNKGLSAKAQINRKDCAFTDRSQTAGVSSADSEPIVPGNSLRRSNTTGVGRPSTAQSTANLLETLNRSNSFTQVPRTASPLKRVGKAPLGSISEHKPRHRSSVVLTVDENGIARTETRHIEDSPTRSIRERYPGLWDSDSSDDDSISSEQPPSRNASFTFVKGEERRAKAARLDPPVENLEGLSIPRSSSRASNKSVTPSRAAIAAAAQLRRQGSIRRPSRTASVKRNAMTSSTGSLIDSCPMDMSAEPQQADGDADVHPGRDNWANIPAQGRSATALDVHNRRWSMMSFEQHQLPVTQRPLQPRQQVAPLIRCLCGVTEHGGSPLVQCSSCTQWLHTHCVGLSGGHQLPPNYTCFLCTKPASGLR